MNETKKGSERLGEVRCLNCFQRFEVAPRAEVAACPMAEIFEDFSYRVSPRGIIERALLDLDILQEVGLWFCLACDLCTDLCPAGVKYRDFVEGARRLALEEGLTEQGLFCQRCGRYFLLLHTLEYLRERLGEVTDGYLALCPHCRRYEWGGRVKEMVPGSRRVERSGR